MKYWVAVITVFLFTSNASSKVRHTSKCSHTLTNQKGSFSTPHILSQVGFYPNNAYCKWNITIPRDGNVTITFNTFYTEACCDHVTLFDEHGKVIAQYSGRKPKFDVTITYNQAHRVDIVFKSDGSLSAGGFEAHYVIHGQSGQAVPTVIPTTPTTQVPSLSGEDSLMEAFLKISSSLTRVINSVLDSPLIQNSRQAETFRSEIYQALQSLGTLKRVTSSALTKDENDQINLALKHLNLKAKTAIKKLQPKLSPAVCKLPRKAGPCRAAMKRYYYDGRRCKWFYYGGCQGNANNFLKLDNCRKICESSRLCPPGVRVFNCFVDPCHQRSCPAYIVTGRCVSNYCGGCNAVYYDQHNLIIPNNRCRCSANEKPVKCAVDPCLNAACPSHPDAKCRARRCDKCTAEFVLSNGTIIQKC